MRGNMSAILEGIQEEFNKKEEPIQESYQVNEGWGDWAKCDSNIDKKKFDDLCKTVKKYKYKITGFQLAKYSSGGTSKYIVISPEDAHNDIIPYINFVDGRFYTYPRMSADFDDVGVKRLIKYLSDANDLCNILNKTKFEDFMTADHPE